MKILIEDTLVMARLGNQVWRVERDFPLVIDDLGVVVPAGFITDGASVPQVFWNLCPPLAGPFGEAAVVHDYLYSAAYVKQAWLPVTRAWADKVLMFIAMYRGASPVRAWLVYLAVRLFGASHFNKE